MSEFPLSVTLKGDGDFDAPWIVVYGNDPDEVKAKVAGVVGLDASKFDALVDLVVEAATIYKGQHVAAKGFSQPSAPAQTQHDTNVTQGPWGGGSGAQQGAQSRSGGGGGRSTAGPNPKSCGHGQRRHVHLKAKKCHAYFCPLEKGDPNQCAPVFEDAE